MHYHGITILQYYNTKILQFYNITLLQFYNITLLQSYSRPVLQYYSIIKIQHYSAGVLQHKIRIEDRTGGLPQLVGDYKKGYDRMTNGLALTEFIGYQHFSNDGRINFYVGFEFTQGFTKNRRSWDFLTQQRMDNNRLDLLNGLRIGWTLPILGDSYDADDIFY